MGNRGRSHSRRGGGDTRLPTGTRRAGSPQLPGRAERRRLARKVKRRRQRSALKEIPLLIGVALLIALVLKTFLVQAFVIPSGSMEQTIRIGDRVLVDKFTPWFGAKPHRGDVVVFKDPGKWLEQEQGTKKDAPVGVKQVKEGLTWIGLLPSDDERDLIKRVVAVGGDTVKCCDKQGRVTVNGTPLNEPYIHPGDVPSKFEFEVKVPKGRLFVMGDHRSNSADSRFHRTEAFSGTVSEESVVGRARVIAWPVGHWSTLPEPSTYATVAAARNGSAAATQQSHRVASEDLNGLIPLPSPAELPLVMGVVGLHRVWDDRRRHGVRSGCGGLGGRRTVRARARRAARAIRRRIGSGRDGRREPRE
ncbi:signal peptidase I [Streptomyces sp. NPDC056121]|uniref:signal peptidase I n=1 Tax=Streptomyces TaxID=1883 RepID=UPI001D0BC7EA|nr:MULTISPECIES: signal peptidase I [Streptomyces]MCX5086618.1 signal peptidase I [Streptomyces sp. NBC_00401]UDM02342.1 signal peptidase I [Streptomyces longhuiensis]